ncbi:MAG TPA: class I poly(R)-hydroxyalkanoic acid synthase [Caulobacteraceae bacterium]|jgi:polyhydroxyalkanoate synthase|nr:class I poly(R)-hydroxyalkanoic acid synthase [Caulobacteraceae bacterium]
MSQTSSSSSPKRKRAAAPSKASLKAQAPAPTPEIRTPVAESLSPGGADAGGELFGLLNPEQRASLETLSVNLARAAITAQTAITEAALKHAGKGQPVSFDPLHVGGAWTEVMGALASHPEKLFKAQADLYGRYLGLWQNAGAKFTGKSDPGRQDDAHQEAGRPARGDKRFADPDWSNPAFDLIKQSYLITSTWLNDLVSGAEGVDPLTRRRVEFVTRMLTDAFSPSNFLVSNPVALRALMETKGESLLKGMENFAADLERGDGHLAISQTDFAQFKVGENVATAPGKVVFQNDVIQLLQFAPSTKSVKQIPLLIFPPWINKYYILDLRPENSMIRWLSSQGFTVFVTSWVNPDEQLATKTFEDYLDEGVYAAVDAVLRQTGESRVNTVGYCIGGTLLSCALAHSAVRGDERIASATFFAAQQDFSEAGDLLIFTNDDWLADLERQMDEHAGVLPGQTMAETFNALRANDLIWSFFVNNYLLGKEPKPFDLLFWNADQTRMPKTLHLFYLRKFYMENALAKAELELAGVRLDLANVKIPVFVQSSREDHIAPARSVYKGARLFGGPTRFTLAGSGHIAGVINAPVAKKYQHWTNPELPPTLEAWLAGAKDQPGSWWPEWSAWLSELSGDDVDARDPAKGPLNPLEDAPGSFVKVRS